MRSMDNIYRKLLELGGSTGVSAKFLADNMGLSRSNVSNALNQLYREDKVIKFDGRPVLYKAKGEGTNSINIEEKTKLDIIGEKQKSLAKCVELAKAAILYPPKGMHTLILGCTGVGKTMFANLMYDYSLKVRDVGKSRPFVTFNCADYSNNPQLLLAQLFGVKKGAYTGANEDRVGLIEKANQGILFLDEVHRLPPEGQEMLFTLIDQGMYRRVGETENTRNGEVVIIAATTENPDSALLNTFIRRIPMTIEIPSLKERTIEERYLLIQDILKEEAVRLNKLIEVSNNAMRAFLSYNCPGNIGQLKSDIQLACAKEYANFLSNKKDGITIRSGNLQSNVKQGLLDSKENREIWKIIDNADINKFIFPVENVDLASKEEEVDIYNKIANIVKDLKIKDLDSESISVIVNKEIEKHFKTYIREIEKDFNPSGILNFINQKELIKINRIIDFCQIKLNRKLESHVYNALVLHLNSVIGRLDNGRQAINEHINMIRKRYPEEYDVSLKGLQEIVGAENASFIENEAAFLAMFFVVDNINNDMDNVKIIQIAHGDTTATSMVNVANRLLGEEYAIGIDAPIDMKPREILDKLRAFIKEDMNERGYLLLVDMGSLVEFAEIIEKEYKIPVRVIPLSSTLHLLEATRKAMLGASLRDIYEEVLSINTTYPMQYVNKKNKSKLVIIVICMSGEGSAVVIKNVINNHIKYDSTLVDVVPINYIGKASIKDRILNSYQEDEIIGIVSTNDIDLEVPQYRLTEVLNLNVIPQIQEQVELKTTIYRMKYEIKKILKRVDGDSAYNEVKKLIIECERDLNIKISLDKLIGTILHMCIMIDRLRGRERVYEYPNKNSYIEENSELVAFVREKLNSIESIFDIKVDDDEICYVVELFKEELEGI